MSNRSPEQSHGGEEQLSDIVSTLPQGEVPLEKKDAFAELLAVNRLEIKKLEELHARLSACYKSMSPHDSAEK